MKYGIHLVTGLGIIILILLGILIFVPAPNKGPTQTQAIEKARSIWRQKHAAGESFDTGPCIAEDLLPDWVADIAHQPRQEQDNLPDNQCQHYRQGQAHHFVELDPQGNLIRAQ